MQLKSNEKLRVFILHWNRPDECARTVGCFTREVQPSAITVIDNDSTRDNVEKLKGMLPEGVSFIVLGKNLGWGGGHNAGLKRWLENETGEFCVVSAHDALPKEGCLGKLVEAMRANPEFGMVCPQYENGEIGVFSPIRGPRVVSCEPKSPGMVQIVDFIHGTLMMFRRDCLKQIGLFDERYFAYGDEFDLALRARKNGWKVGMVWGAVVINPGTWVARPVVTYLCTRGTLLLARDHGGIFSATIRAVLVLMNSFRLWLTPDQKREVLCHPKARIAAVRDFYLGRFGAPPSIS